MKKSLGIISLVLFWVQGAFAFSLSLSPQEGAKEKFESNHGGKPVRIYYLQGKIQPNAQAWMINAEGKKQPLTIIKKKGSSLVMYKSKWGDGPNHGVNQIYVSQTTRENSSTVIETAQWFNVQHNCGWGHDHKYDLKRQQLKSSGEGLEIQMQPMWDGKYHIQSHAGDLLELLILMKGKPQAGVTVAIETKQGWVKTMTSNAEGKVTFSLIRDYYTSEWKNLHPNKPSRLQIKATFSDNGITYINKLPWRYNLVGQDYSSELSGALIIFSSLLGSFLVIFFIRKKSRKRRIL